MEAAVNWMKAGLPLRMLKIVLYCRGQDDEAMLQTAERGFARVFTSFEGLKERYMMKDLTPKVQQSIACSETSDDEHQQELGRERVTSVQANSDFSQ